MYKHFYIFLSSILLCYLPTFAQPLQCTQYSLADGLVGNNVQKILQDHNGFIWISTWDGLCRYDGGRFTPYTTRNGMPTNFILDFLEIKPGTLLVAPARNKLMKIVDGKLHSGTEYSHALISRFLFATNGQLIALSGDSGILKWQGEKFVPVDPVAPLKLDDLMQFNDSLYIAIENTRIWLLDKNFKTVGPEENPKPRENLGFFADNHHNKWVGTSHGICMLADQQRQGMPVRFQPLPTWMAKTPVNITFTRSLLQDNKGRYWIGNEAGLFFLDSSGYGYHFNTANGLPANIVTYIMQDREDNVWVGTSTGVVKITLRNYFRLIKASDGLPIAQSHNLVQVNEAKALLFSYGRSWLDLRNGRIYVMESFKLDRKRRYRTAENEVVVLHERNVEIYRDGNSEPIKRKWNGPIHAFLVRRFDTSTYFMGKIPAGFEVESPEGLITDSLSIPHRISACVIDKNGNLWVGTWFYGVYHVKMWHHNGQLKWETKKVHDSLFMDIEVRSMYIDKDDRVWVGSRRGGVVCLKAENDSIRLVHAFSSRDKLSSDFVHVIREDSKKNIWVGTGHGMVKMIPTDTGYRAFHFSKMHKTPISIYEITFLNGGRLIASGTDGLIMAHDDEMDTLSPPSCFITEIITPGQKAPDNFVDPFKLLHHNPNIIFHFTAPVYFNEKLVEFSYRLLDGGDTAWMASSHDRSVNFANLRPGKYQFEVRARGWNDEWGQPATYNFSVTTPFWRQWWFIVLCIIAIGCILHALYRYRINQIIKIHKVRDAIAADLHDEIGSTLTNINILTNLTRRNIGITEKAEDFLKRISEEAVATQHSLDDIIWSVNKDNDSMESTVWRMRRYASELFDEAGVQYNIELEEGIEEIKLVMQQRKDLYLLYKEAINNIAKHARSTKVSIDIRIMNQTIEMDIKDNGIGFLPGEAPHRNGMKTMHARVEKWNGTIKIDTIARQGTQISIALPIARN